MVVLEQIQQDQKILELAEESISVGGSLLLIGTIERKLPLLGVCSSLELSGS